MNINHNKVHNKLLKKDFIPSAKTKWLWNNIYQDAEGTTIINVKKPQDLVTYLNTSENNNVVHKNISEEVHDTQENVQ